MTTPKKKEKSMSEQYTAEEIKIAYREEQACCQDMDHLDGMIQRLTRHAIHPDVPVMYHSGHDDSPMLVFAGRVTHDLARRGDILVAIDTVKLWLRQRRVRGEKSGYGCSAEEEITAKIADYTRNGPEAAGE